MSGHVILPDGYCETCGRVPCRFKSIGGSSKPPQSNQLDRIEAKLNRILRHIGIDTESST